MASSTKKAAKAQRKAARKTAREDKKDLRQRTRAAKQDNRQEKKATKKAGRKSAKATRKSARAQAKDIKADAKGASKSERKDARKSAKATRKAGRVTSRSTKKTARKSAKTTAKTQRKQIKDNKQERLGAIKAEKKKAIQTTKTGWQNWLHDLQTDARRVTPPKTMKELRELVEAAVRAGKRLKPVASGHSHSNATQPTKDHWYVDISQLSGLISTEKESSTWRRKPSVKVARVKAGTRLQVLNSQILPPKNLAVLNMGSFDGQTVSGAVNTDTHGTGTELGGFGDMVLSADVFVVVPGPDLKPTVELWRLEPSEGLTNPRKEAELRRKGIQRLVQDDDLFHAIVVGFGSMGIAFSYLMEVRSFYWLEEKARISTVDGLSEQFAEASEGHVPAFLSRNRHTWAFVNAAWAQVDNAKTEKGDPRTIGQIPVRLLTQNEVRPKAIPSNFKHKVHPIWPPMRHRDDICESLGKAIGTKTDSGKEPGRGVAAGIDNFFIEDSQEPFFHTGSQSACYRVLRRTRDGALQRARTPGSKWDNTRISGPPVAPTLALSMDVSVPHWTLIKSLKRVLREYKAETIRLNVPIGIRFTAPSKHMMAASYGRVSAFMELAGLVENKAKRTRDLQRYKRSFTQIGEALRKTTGQARPHLGKHHGLNHDLLLRTYPRAKDWMQIQGYMNSSGTWSSPFTRSLGASRYKQSARATRQWLERRLGL